MLPLLMCVCAQAILLVFAGRKKVIYFNLIL